METYKKQSDDRPVENPRLTPSVQFLLKTGDNNHPLVKGYLEKKKAYDEQCRRQANEKKKSEPEPLPPLNPIDMEDLYRAFKEFFGHTQGKPFNEMANHTDGFMYGETGILARTLCTYFIGHPIFLKSPILNRKSEPNLRKGLMIIGGYGCGKTSTLKTFYEMFIKAKSHPITIKDIKGIEQFLRRYGMYFSFHTANDIVAEYEGLQTPDEKDYFWRIHKGGFKYYDDVMTERTASNFGKIELFKDIFEHRYSTGVRTIITLNYAGNSVDETLNSIAERYGERVYDRLFEMFNIIELKGKSLRK